MSLCKVRADMTDSDKPEIGWTTFRVEGVYLMWNLTEIREVVVEMNMADSTRCTQRLYSSFILHLSERIEILLELSE